MVIYIGRLWCRTRGVRPGPTVIAAAIVAFAVLSGCDQSDTSAGQTTTAAAGPNAVPGASTARPGVSAPASIEPPGTDTGVDSSRRAPAGDAPKAAETFARAWVRRNLTAARWLAGISPLCEPSFSRLLTTVDPRNVPADHVTGTPKAVRKPAERSAEYTVATDAGNLTVQLVDLHGRWLVSGNAFTPSNR
jgi:hypothetical protein